MSLFHGFESDRVYYSQKGDLAFWQPTIEMLLEQHDLKQSIRKAKPGFNSTYPVFVLDDVVIKFFCHRKHWQQVYEKECAVHTALAKDASILAPNLIGSGQISTTPAPLAYAISTRIQGDSWLNQTLSREQQLKIFSELGCQLKKVHALSIDGLDIERLDSFAHLDVQAAARSSSLPGHLIDQIVSFLAALPPFDYALVNSDIVLMHIFINNGSLSGIIDWGDAAITDRHYELGKLCLEFPGDKALLGALLNAAEWPITEHFAHQALGMALYRQAMGLTQHSSFDTFHKLPGAIKGLDQVKSLDELSSILFELN